MGTTYGTAHGLGARPGDERDRHLQTLWRRVDYLQRLERDHGSSHWRVAELDALAWVFEQLAPNGDNQ